MKLTLVKRQTETADVESFYWQPDVTPVFKPGQYLKWTIDDEHPDERGISRFFSIASAPTEELIINTTKFSSERSSSFKAALKNFSIGDTIKAFGPMGSFVLPDERSEPLVFLAGGIGITPFRSMLKFAADTGLSNPVQLLYACRTPSDIAFKALFDDLQTKHDWLKVTYVVETPNADWRGESGRLDAERIKSLAGGLDDKKTYLSGPEPMVRAFKDGLVASGVAEDNLMTDYFPGYTL